MASTALDLITGALLNINSYSPGETLAPEDASTCLAILNDLLDSLSLDKAFIFTQTENIFPWIAGQYQYSIGNPILGTFCGVLTGGSPTITGVSVPPDLVVNGDLSDVGAAIPDGTVVLDFGATTITMGDAFGNPVSAAFTSLLNPDVITYTGPGDIKIPRPIRINDSFTRTNSSANANLDYAFEILSFDRYKEELLKNIQGPWPYVAAYQPTFPLGTLYVYPCPGANYTAHLFTDLILSEFANTTTKYALPQGYTRALKKLLALELAPNYGKTPSPLLIKQAKEARASIETVNDSPVVTLRYDTAISRSQTTDAGWIIGGGFQ